MSSADNLHCFNPIRMWGGDTAAHMRVFLTRDDVSGFFALDFEDEKLDLLLRQCMDIIAKYGIHTRRFDG